MEEHRICIHKALLYESFALFLEVKGRLIDACMIYHLGISRFVNFFDIDSFVCISNVNSNSFLIIFCKNKGVLAFRNAEPLGRLKKAQVLFLERMSERVLNGSFQKVCLNSFILTCTNTNLETRKDWKWHLQMNNFFYYFVLVNFLSK